MDHKLSTEILSHKKALSKSLRDKHDEHVNDILLTLIPLPLTADIIQSTRIGHLVAEIKKNYSMTLQQLIQQQQQQQQDNIDGTITSSSTSSLLLLSSSIAMTQKIVENTKSLLVQWKRIIETSTNNTSNTSMVSSSAALLSSSNPSSSTAQSSSIASSSTSSKVSVKTSHVESAIDESLGEQRRKVFELILQILSSSTPSTTNTKAIAGASVGIANVNTSGNVGLNAAMQRKARDIELAINTLHPHEVDHKQYASKARTLAFNLKRNQPLLHSVQLDGITPTQLVHLSAEELANQELVDKRKVQQQEDNDERRLDWLDEHREAIQKEIGIEPTDFEYEELTLSDNDD